MYLIIQKIDKIIFILMQKSISNAIYKNIILYIQ